MRQVMGGSFGRDIPALFASGGSAGLTDGQLLERFATRRGDASERAFAALVERHGPMVVRTCRAALGDEHEAMDAFQTTFLALARRGHSLWVRDSIGPWLHRVARRASARARAAAARRRDLERRAASAAVPPPAAPDADLAAALHEEVDRLPERYRVPLVLCDLEGQTCEDVARHLGRAVGTVKSWRARGRARLRDRLLRRGLTPAAAWPFAPEVASPLPPALAATTAGLVGRTLSTGAFPAAVNALVRREWIAMLVLKLKWVAAATAAGLAAVTVAASVGQEPAPPAKTEKANETANATNTPANKSLEPNGTGVRVSRPVTRRVADSVLFTGHLEAHSVSVDAPTGATVVDRVDVRDGQSVKKGDPLLQMKPLGATPGSGRAASSAAEGLELTKRRLATAENRHARVAALHKAGAVSDAEVEDADDARLKAEAAVLESQQAYDQAKRLDEKSVIRSPIAGVVSGVDMFPGRGFGRGAKLLTVTATDSIWVDFQIDEGTYLRNARQKRAGKRPFLEPGTPVRVGLASDENFPRAGKIESVGDRFDPNTGTLPVRVTVENPEGELLPGMFARVRVETGEPRPAVLVPAKAVFSDQGKRGLYVVSDRNVAHCLVDGKDVKLGGTYDGLVEVAEGFLGSELVAVDPSQVAPLRPGTILRPEVVPSPENETVVPGRPR